MSLISVAECLAVELSLPVLTTWFYRGWDSNTQLFACEPTAPCTAAVRGGQWYCYCRTRQLNGYIADETVISEAPFYCIQLVEQTFPWLYPCQTKLSAPWSCSPLLAKEYVTSTFSSRTLERYHTQISCDDNWLMNQHFKYFFYKCDSPKFSAFLHI